MKNYEYIVVGNGLIGSAAARYLSQWHSSVAIIGPGEPDDPIRHDGVFSSHYDQGRLTHVFNPDPVWAVIAAQAVQNYPMLAEVSGVEFHGPVGRVAAIKPTPQEKEARLRWMAEVDPMGEKLYYFEAGDQTWQQRFPFLRFPVEYDLFYEAPLAGYINPRDLLRAQNIIARQNGATIIPEQVADIISTVDGVTMTTAQGEQYVAQKVLIACGAFTNFNNLLPAPLPLRLKTETMVWGEVSPETAQRLQTMPGVGYDIEHPEIDDIYMAPPLLYPDGTYKIKIGCNSRGESWPTTLDDLQTWFRQGNSDVDLLAMEWALRKILPNVDFFNITSHRCIVTYTPSGYPTIDQVASDRQGRLFIATGGNGNGAGGSDTLGHLAHINGVRAKNS